MVSFKKDLNRFITTDYQQELHTNMLRTVNFQEDFSGYQDLIFALGDSYTHGTGLPVDAAYPFQLDLMLNFNNGVYTKRYGVVNLGHDGIGGKQALCILKKYSACLKNPRFILYQGCDNDYIDDFVYSELAQVMPFSGNPRVTGVLQWFVEHSETVATLYKVYFGHYRNQIANHIRFSNRGALQEPVLNELKALADTLNARLIITWADIYSEDAYYWVRSWAEKHDVLFADWAKGVKSTEHELSGIPLKNHHSAGHYRTWVNYIIARSFEDKIKQVNDQVLTGNKGL